MSDEELIRRHKEGDPEAFGEILRRFGKPLYGYLVGMVKDETAAADLFQETFMRLLKSVDTYEEQGRLGSWLFAIAHNLAQDHFRKIGRTFVEESLDEGREDAGTTLADLLASPEPGPEEAALHAEMHSHIEEAFEKLSPEQREVFYLREYAGLSFKEVAESLGCPLGTVLARMSRGLKKLRLELEGFYA